MSKINFCKILASMLVFCLVLTSVPGLVIPIPAYALNEKVSTAIVGIDCPAELDLPVRIEDALSAAMVKSHRFEVTDSAQVASTVKDMGLEGVSLNMTQMCDVGKALGVDTVTVAQGFGIESDNEKCYITVSAQVIDVASGIVIQSAFATGEGFKGEKFELTDEAIQDAVQSVVNQMNDNFAKVGLIALMKDGEIRLNIGGDIGIKNNSEFVVYREDKVIGKLKTKELDSYDIYAEKVIVLPGYTLQEGDIVVLASNQGEEIDRVGSPQTLQKTSSKTGLILLAILAGVAIALIATNEGNQVEEQAVHFIFEDYSTPIITGTSPSQSAFVVVTLLITDNKNRPVADGTLIKAIEQTGTAYDLPLQYQTSGGRISFGISKSGDFANGGSISFQVEDTEGHISPVFSVPIPVTP